MKEYKKAKVAVVLPTFNEAKNINKILPEILRQDERIIVVVVDDDSPDGTGKIAQAMAQIQPARIKVLHRKERGRASAGLEGFKYCLRLGVDYIIEMDADFSHDPNELPNFLNEIEHYDIVIGSRYINGGGAVNCPYYGKLISFAANTFNRFLLGYKIRDNSGGFKCYRREVLEFLDLDRVISKGYSIGAEILYYCYLNNFTMKEIPIIFRNREEGKSKQNLKIIFGYPKDILHIRFFPKIKYKRLYSEYSGLDSSFCEKQTVKEEVGFFRSWYHSSRYHLLQQLIIQYKQANSLILDLGCGSCDWNSLGLPVIGLDINKNLLMQAVRKQRIKQQICCDIEQLSLKENSIDIIVASEILEHIIKLNEFISGCRRILKNKGKMIVTVPYDFIFSPFYILFGVHCFIQGYIRNNSYYKKQCGHINNFTKAKIRKLFEENGFRIKNISIFNYFLIVVIAEKENENIIVESTIK